MIYWFFGYPGIGKDHCAERLSQLLGCPHIDSDTYLTDTERTKLLTGQFTSRERVAKLQRICDDISKKLKKNTHLTVADSLPDEAARRSILKAFPSNVTLILVTASYTKHEKRLGARRDHFFTSDLLADYIATNWKPVESQYLTFVNNSEDLGILDSQLRDLIKNHRGRRRALNRLDKEGE